MIRYLAKRTGTALFVLFALSILVFSMVRLIPGDPAAQYLNTSDPDPEALAAIREQLGLTRPWYEQFMVWLGGVLSGDFGTSLTRPFDITTQIAERLPASVELAVIATIFSLLIGIPFGALSAVRSGKVADSMIRAGSFLFLSVPAFVVGTVLILANSRTLKFPLIGYTPLWEDPVRSIMQMLVPAIVLALPMGAILCRYTRNTLLDALSQDYIRTARAKGADTSRLVIRHALRNALVPVSTVVGIQLGTMIGGTIIVESIFALPGMGSMLIEALNSTDYPTIQGCVLVLGAVYIAINLAVDMLYPLIDPRIRTVN